MVRLAKTATMIFIATNIMLLFIIIGTTMLFITTNIMLLFIIIHSGAGEFRQVNLIDRVDKRNQWPMEWHE